MILALIFIFLLIPSFLSISLSYCILNYDLKIKKLESEVLDVTRNINKMKMFRQFLHYHFIKERDIQLGNFKKRKD